MDREHVYGVVWALKVIKAPTKALRSRVLVAVEMDFGSESGKKKILDSVSNPKISWDGEGAPYSPARLVSLPDDFAAKAGNVHADATVNDQGLLETLVLSQAGFAG